MPQSAGRRLAVVLGAKEGEIIDEKDDRNADDEDEEDDDDDFMSDKFLVEANDRSVRDAATCPSQSYSERRRRHLDSARDKGRTRSRAEREVEARQLGLARSLIGKARINAKDARVSAGDVTRDKRRSASPDVTSQKVMAAREVSRDRTDDRIDIRGKASSATDDSSPALRMMLAMGFRPGQALGRDSHASPSTRERGPEQDGTAGSPASYAQAPSAAVSSEPIAIDERWLGKKRFGIGSALAHDIHKAIERAKCRNTAHKGASAEETQDVADFRTRAREQQEAKHIEALLAQARKTCEELDRNLGIDFSPIWLNPEALTKLPTELPAHIAALVSFAFVGLDQLLAKEKQESDHKENEKEQTLKTEHDENASVVEGSEDGDDDDDGDETAMARAVESRRFCKLGARARLDITLSHLRRAHAYCLFCGVQYTDAKDLDAQCPGETEEEH